MPINHWLMLLCKKRKNSLDLKGYEVFLVFGFIVGKKSVIDQTIIVLTYIVLYHFIGSSDIENPSLWLLLIFTWFVCGN